MIERIARRAGGFASTTALRWIGGLNERVPEIELPQAKKRSAIQRLRKPLTGGAVASTLMYLSSNKTVRSGVSKGLRMVAETLRTDASTSRSSTSSKTSSTHRSNGAGHTSATGGNGSDSSLSTKTRAELYEIAKKKDLPGRSSMSKQELAKALSSS